MPCPKQHNRASVHSVSVEGFGLHDREVVITRFDVNFPNKQVLPFRVGAGDLSLLGGLACSGNRHFEIRVNVLTTA
jgi:hypothetical protein